MHTIPQAQLLARKRVENPWWSETPSCTDDVYRNMHPRACVQSFAKQVEPEDVRRAGVLLGPRRVGKTVHRIDRSARRFKRVNFFKVYLTNPSIHCALFGPPKDGETSGALVETAVFAQLFHLKNYEFHYARWPKQGPLRAFLKRHPGMNSCFFFLQRELNPENLM